jgi:PPE-repeat protein
MDFATLPPEVNSARMYAGAGAGPMLTAAAAWDGLAADLRATATSYQSVIAGLTSGPWLGPSSVAMAAAAAPYVGWVSTTAAQAEQAGGQAKAAVAAYEAAFAATVSPPMIAANRALLMALIATNALGQNAPAIAATEAHYGEMWAQDAAAMYGYAGGSAAASTLTPFTPPAPATNPAGQGAALVQAVGASAGNEMQTGLSQLMSTVPTALQGLAQPLQSTSGLSGTLQSLGFTTPASFLSLFSPYSAAVTSTGASISTVNLSTRLGAVPGGAAPVAADTALQGRVGSGIGALGSAGPAGLEGSAVTAGLGRAASVGALSVSPSWAAVAPAAPAVRLMAAELPGTSVNGAPAVSTGMPGGVFGESLLGTLAGRGIGSFGPRGRVTVMARPPDAG